MFFPRFFPRGWVSSLKRRWLSKCKWATKRREFCALVHRSRVNSLDIDWGHCEEGPYEPTWGGRRPYVRQRVKSTYCAKQLPPKYPLIDVHAPMHTQACKHTLHLTVVCFFRQQRRLNGVLVQKTPVPQTRLVKNSRWSKAILKIHRDHCTKAGV